MKIAYVCNVFDPKTRESNNITSDSPAAFNKVFNVSRCIQIVNQDISIISISILNSRKKRLGLSGKKIDGIDIHYFNLPRNKILRHIFIQFKLSYFFLRNKYDGMILYNYSFDYFILAIIAFMLNKRIIVDIEDGINKELFSFLQIGRNILLTIYLCLSKHKALVVSSLLQNDNRIKKSFIVYGSGKMISEQAVKNTEKISLLYNGTMIEQTGVFWLIELIEKIANIDEISKNIVINICGYGVLSNKIRECTEKYNFVNYYGFVSDSEYKSILKNTDIGLVLRLKDSSMAQTTFPSKIVEFALNRLAIITTPSSDIPILFNENEVIFVNNIKDMIENIIYFIEHREELEARKKLIAEKAAVLFEEKAIGKNIVELFQAG